MAVKTRTELEGYLETGDKPDQDEWKDILDSTWLKSETIPIQQIVVSEQQLTCDATTVWDFANGGNAVLEIDQDTTIDLQNMEVGNFGHLLVEQDGTGGWNITLPAGALVGYAGAGAITLSADPGAIDVLSVYRSSKGYTWLINKTFT